MANTQNEIILYQPDNAVKLDVLVENETVWLNRNQLAILFDRDVKTIGKHINNALQEELAAFSTVANFATVQTKQEYCFSHRRIAERFREKIICLFKNGSKK
jgi:hypothetical protein